MVLMVIVGVLLLVLLVGSMFLYRDRQQRIETANMRYRVRGGDFEGFGDTGIAEGGPLRVDRILDTTTASDREMTILHALEQAVGDRGHAESVLLQQGMTIKRRGLPLYFFLPYFLSLKDL